MTATSIVEKPKIPFTPYFDLDGITIYHADCMRVFEFLPEFDLLLTDPPYGMNAMDGTRAKRYKIDRKHNWDANRPSKDCFEKMMSRAKDSIIWGMNYFCDMLPPHKKALVWHKPHVAHLPNRSDAELAFTSLDGGMDFVSMYMPDFRVHPTQKPTQLMQWCLRFAPDAKTVFDPFMGSGTTLVAAKLEGKKAVGIEINERYCESAAKRLQQGMLF